MNMWGESHQWHYDYVRLAEDSGFTFTKQKKQIDKPILLVDTDRIINERDIGAIEKCIPSIINYTLDSDQMKVLDSSFVNTFRLCQLSVEYLLFCKKYLDDTTMLLKKDLSQIRIQNKELKESNEELKAQMIALTNNLNQNHKTFKCFDCNKIFSTEEFLNSHKKRRHNNEPLLEGVDKLQIEIKELKGRLNSAEKFVNNSNADNKTKNDDEIKFKELQANLEDLKNHMEEELRALKEQKQFEEKLINSLRPPTPIVYYEKEVATDNLIKQQIECTTQTEEEPAKNNQIQQQTIEDILDQKVSSRLQHIENQMEAFFKGLNSAKAPIVEDFHEIIETFKPSPQMGDNDHKIVASSCPIERKESMTQTQIFVHDEEPQHHKIEEILDHKVTSKLQDIEQQIQVFFNKLQPSSRASNRSEAGDSCECTTQPQPKPRTKLSTKSLNDCSNGLEIEEKPNNLTIDSVFKAIEDSVNSLVKENERIRIKSHSRSSSDSIRKKSIENTFLPIINNNKPEKDNNNIKKPDPESDDLVESLDLSENEIRLIKEYKECSPKPPNRIRDVSEILYETDEDTSDGDGSCMDDLDAKRTSLKPSGTTLDKRSLTSLKRVALDPTVLDHFKKEIERLVKRRLQELGVAPNWRGIPKKTYDRVLEIFNHQVLLTKKNYRLYDMTRNEIEKAVHEKAFAIHRGNNGPPMQPNDKLKREEKTEMKKIDNKHLSQKLSKFRTINRNIKSNVSDTSRLSSSTNSQTKTKGNKPPPMTNYYLMKKRVLFDLKKADHILSDDKNNRALNKNNNEEDTTSMSSSVFDDDKKRL